MKGGNVGKMQRKKTPNTGLLHHEDRGRENRRGRRDCADGTSLRGENLRPAEQGQNYRRLCFSSFLSAKVVFFLFLLFLLHKQCIIKVAGSCLFLFFNKYFLRGVNINNIILFSQWDCTFLLTLLRISS